MLHLLPSLEKTWQSRSASHWHFALPRASPAPGQADSMTIVPGCGLEDRQRYLPGWLEPSAGGGLWPSQLPACSSALSFSRASGSCRDSEVVSSPFLKVWLKIKRVVKPSPAHEAECVGVMLTNTWGCEASQGSWHPSGRHVFSFSSFFLWHLFKEHMR